MRLHQFTAVVVAVAVAHATSIKYYLLCKIFICTTSCKMALAVYCKCLHKYIYIYSVYANVCLCMYKLYVLINPLDVTLCC